MLAESIRSVGMLLVAITPMVLAAYALSKLNAGDVSTDELNELLIEEFAATQPSLPMLRRPPAAGIRRGDLYGSTDENDGDTTAAIPAST